MATIIHCAFTIVPPPWFRLEEEPSFCLELIFQHHHFRLFRNLGGHVMRFRTRPVDQSSSLFQIHPDFLSHSSTCHDLLDQILSSCNVDDEARLRLAPQLVADLLSITTKELMLMGFHAVALVEIIHEEFIDAEDFLMMLTTMDAEEAVEPRRRVSRSAMNKMKEEAFTAEESGGGDCAICLEEFSGEVKLIKLDCGHTFHERCIFRWLQDHNSCPMCRHEVEI